ncbi:2-oxoacid:ferredoxin oxidoreductase subunit beta [Hufsiella ginkgonis]|uniref:2-oxoacid:ferredoxin oxidoreductase subunit beta n=1 Tax=Hufsiella ginkgonis TaxID=2695274 RepID=A0A7K1XTE1_9SPHI|nr:2-oxoacid:ferredoxin oxidoreductase subunit beta [Hufsiella ginkgonis]MXV14108.1 2-oxoacid:ferredoxin oxidoreductase subunit beta [Hufsiella ginkgonis]
MTYIRPKFRHPSAPTNDLGYTKREYEGALSTLCAGCGHDSISGAIIQAYFELSVPPHRIAKLSGIGCSSKTPTYFLGKSHGFNSVHGRMPSVATGANMANRDLMYLGVSGDGDTASIGMGQFVHIVRRNLNIVYIVMNNGCYGLTKGQDSATADAGSKSKAGSVNPFQPIDLAGLALELGAGFVAQSFSGDKPQLIELIKEAVKYPGFALINVISPCVTFNNNPGSTKSYDYVREHIEATATVDYVPLKTEITAAYAEGTGTDVEMHDGTFIRLEKLAAHSNPYNRLTAITALQVARMKNAILTGLVFLEPDPTDLHETLDTSEVALNKMTETDLCPGKQELENINASLR